MVSADYFKHTKGRTHDYQAKVALGIAVITWWINHSIPHGMLSKKQLDVYGRTFKLTLPVVTRWGNHVNSMETLLDTRQAMRSLVLESRHYLEEVSTSKAYPSRETTMVMDAIEESDFWREFETVRDHLKPVMVTTHFSLLLLYAMLLGLRGMHCTVLGCALHCYCTAMY